MKIIKKISAILIAAALALSITACGEDTKWVYKIGGKEVSSGLYLAFQMSALSSATSHKDFDSSLEDIYKNKLDGLSLKDWVNKEAKSSCAQYVAVENEFGKLNLTLSQDDKDTIAQTVKTNWEYLKSTYEKNSVAESTYKLIITNSYKSQKVFNAYYDQNGKTPVADAEVTKYFEENYAYVNIFGMQLETAESGKELTDDQKKTNAGLQTKANGYVNQINEGTLTFNQAKDKYTASVNSEYKSGTISEDKDTKVLYKKDGTSPSEAVVKAIFASAADGKAKVISDSSAYYISVRYPFATDGSDLTTNRTTVLMAMKGTDYTDMIKKWADALDVTANDKAVSRYKPENLDLKSSSAS